MIVEPGAMSADPTFTATGPLPMGAFGSAERRRFEAAYRQQYHPCDTGLHVCGLADDDILACGAHFTVLNLPMRSDAARSFFEQAKAAFEVADEEGRRVDGG